MNFISSLIRSLFLMFMLLVVAPTILFLAKSYYAHFIAKKTYIGVIELPKNINDAQDIISAAKNLFSCPEIRSLILICDSKGGNTGSCLSIHADLIRLKELYQKPIIAFIERECLNGAYAIATSSDFIVASPGAIIGNITTFDFENLENEYDKSILQNYQDQYFNLLKKYRSSIDENTIENLKNKNVTGLQALKLNIIDSLGGKLEVEKIIRGKTVIEGRIEEVRGSLGEHFIFYISHIIHRIINGIK